MDEWVDELLDGWIDGSIDTWMDGYMRVPLMNGHID